MVLTSLMQGVMAGYEVLKMDFYLSGLKSVGTKNSVSGSDSTQLSSLSSSLSRKVPKDLVFLVLPSSHCNQIVSETKGYIPIFAR
jgi:hypothetical protein